MSGPISLEVLSTHTPALFAAAVQRAAELLRAGEVVALPTETVYGLAANALDPVAVAKIYEMKGRPAHNPIIVHVSDTAMAKSCVANWPDHAGQLAKSFWPGPLTLVLPKNPAVPDAVTTGGPTVAVRCPNHPLALELLRAAGVPVAAPSANRSGELSPTTADHVLASANAPQPPTSTVASLLEYVLTVSPEQSRCRLTTPQAVLLARQWFFSSPPLLWLLALRAFGAEEYEDAAALLERLVHLGRMKTYDPTAAFDPSLLAELAFMNLGNCYLRLDDPARAETYFTLALSSPAHQAQARQGIARARAAQT